MIKKFLKRFWSGNKNIVLKSCNQPLKPRWIWFEVTDNCNSHCTHCQIWKKENCSNPLTLEEMEKIFKDPILSEVETIINSGGEAILRPDIVDIIKLQHKIFPNAILDLSTNGILADRVLQVVEEVMAAGIKLNVGVSLDGMGEKHDQIRGVPGNFAKVDYLLKKLIEMREKYPELLSVIVGLTLSKLTLDGWQEVKEYTDKLKVELMVQWYNQSSFYENSKDESDNLKEEMKKAVEAQPNSTTRERWLKLLDNKSIKFQCYAANTFFAMKCDGSVIPCLTHWDLVIGNAREKSITEIWNSPEAKVARKTVSNCSGCLNSWGLNWSLSSSFYPRIGFFLRNPREIFKRLKAGK